MLMRRKDEMEPYKLTTHGLRIQGRQIETCPNLTQTRPKGLRTLRRMLRVCLVKGLVPLR